jgi:hypothetical protein
MLPLIRGPDIIFPRRNKVAEVRAVEVADP